MSDKKRILILSFSNLERDCRISRQIIMLKNHYHITAIGVGNPNIEGIDFLPLPNLHKQPQTLIERTPHWIRMITRRFDADYWAIPRVQNMLSLLDGLKADLIIGNDIETLPLSVRLRKKFGAKVLIDAHEYAPKWFEHRLKDRLIYNPFWDNLCRRYLPQVDAMVTVCDGIAKEYSKNYGLPCGVITNAPFYQKLQPKPAEEGRIRMIHHGGLSRSRQLENMVYLIDLLDKRFSLDFMLVPNHPDYYHELQHLTRTHPRIKFRPPVPIFKIPLVINEYDIGLYPLNRTSFNKRMSLPNKLFDFIQGRLAIAIWPSQEMASIVKENKCGVVSNDFTIKSLAQALNRLTAKDINKYKKNSHKIASCLCAEVNRKKLLKIVQDLLGA